MDSSTPRTAAEVIDAVLEARSEEQAAAARQLELAVEWALLHPCRDEYPAAWDDGGLFSPSAPLAGSGAPLVDEFAPASLAAALGISLAAGKQLMADALELIYRLPRLWDLVLAGRVPVWRARAISRETHDLDTDAVAYADRLITAVPDKVDQVDASRLIHEARLYFDPDRAVADEEHELSRRGVWVKHRGNPATTDVIMTLDTPDALAVPRSRHHHRRRARAPSATPTTSTSAEPGRSGSSPTPSTPSTSSPASTAAPPPPTPQGRSTSTCTSPPPTSPATDRRAPGRCRSRSSAPPPPSCSPTGWPGTPQSAGRSTSAPSSTSTDGLGGRPARPTRQRCANRSSCATPTACSPAAAATPGPATSTTSPPTSRWTTADHRAKPDPAISRPCAAPITGSRPTPPGTTNASTVAATPGPHPPATSTTSTPPPARPPDRRT